MAELAPSSLAFWAKCRSCFHCWPAAYYPHELGRFARIIGRAICPKCGDRKPLIAKQADGILMEPGDAR